MTRARALLEYLPIRVAGAVLRWMPRRAALAMGRLAGHLAWMLDGPHRRVALRNLGEALGDSMDGKSRRRLARRVFGHFGTVAVECLLLHRLRPGDVERLIDYEGREHLQEAFLKGKGVLLFSGHYGSWEVVTVMQGFLGYPGAIVARPLDNPYLDRLLVRNRTSSGNLVIRKRKALREIVRALRKAWAVGIMIDQDARGTDPVFVDFFGRPAATIPTLALLALRTGAPIVPVFGIPLPGGRYRISYLPEVPVKSSGDREADVRIITQECTRLIEDRVREHPEYWLWMHKRWKSRPGRKHRPVAGALAGQGDR